MDALQPPPPMPFPSRVVNTFAAPGAVGESLAAHPFWGSALTLCVVLATASSGMLYLTPVGKKTLLEKMRKEAVRQGSTVGVEWMEKHYEVVAVWGMGVAFLFSPVGVALVAGVLWLVFSVFMGADLRFPHHLAIASHASFISLAGGLVSLAIMLARGTMRSTLSLAAFVPGVPETSPVYLVLAMFDFFALWWLAATGVMVARAGRLSTWKPVVTLLILYFVIAGAVVGVSLLIGSFTVRAG